jgi:Bax protein
MFSAGIKPITLIFHSNAPACNLHTQYFLFLPDCSSFKHKLSMKYFSIIYFVLIIFSGISCSTEAPKEYSEEDIRTRKPLPESHIKFIVNFYPNVKDVNKEIIEHRNKLIEYKSDFTGTVASSRKLKRLNRIADEYRLTDSLFNDELTQEEFNSRIDHLLKRVNIIPEKLIMAQAIIESGWGTSKYAKSINNYFGIHCHTPGCGEPPSAIENPKFWVKSFPNIESCIEEYIWNLNTGFAFKDLRDIRLDLVNNNKPLTAYEIAKGLERYSEKGSEYITLVRSIVKNYLPKDLDAFVYHYGN